jgi:hypothetical protein
MGSHPGASPVAARLSAAGFEERRWGHTRARDAHDRAATRTDGAPTGAIDEAPKSTASRLAAGVGIRLRWYDIVEEQGGASS